MYPFSFRPSQVLTMSVPETPNEFFFRFVLVSICSTRQPGQRLSIEDRQFAVVRLLNDAARRKSTEAVLSQFFDLHPRITTVSIHPLIASMTSIFRGVLPRERKFHLCALIVVKLVNIM